MLRSSAASSTMRSSPSSTANGSSPTCWRATDTAWPRPSGSCWRTKWRSARSAQRLHLLQQVVLARSARAPPRARARGRSGPRSRPLPRPLMTRMSGARRGPPPRRRTGSRAVDDPAASPWGCSSSPAGSACRARRRGSRPCEPCSSLRDATARRFPAEPVLLAPHQPAQVRRRAGRGSRARART